IRQALRKTGRQNAVEVQPPPQIRKLSGKVVLDAGHGGNDPGTTVAAGHPEKTVNLALASEVAGLLRKRGIEIVMTRTSDRAVDLDDRVNIANRSGASLFVSIHSNSSNNSSVSGYEVIYPASAPGQAVKAANCVSQRLSAAGTTRQSVRPDNRGLRVLTNTRIPAILVETGYLSNRAEAAKLVSSPYQARLAQAIADGICDFLSR
ncbi:MAG: N-acetylmuramoyl-L-alanine amidase, partial [Planctomycetes bacterium]|nr:N-acetylmuramoyl-L-alanine amidase [Planctomycetota bacterium]